MNLQTQFKDRLLSLGLARVTEAAALSCVNHIGRGDEEGADKAAVDAMRTQLNLLDIDGTVVIGEGERDEAPMLFIGEKVGSGNGPKVDIALDPLEGTSLTAKDMPNALTVIAMGPENSILLAPDLYMQKLAIGPNYPPGIVHLDMEPSLIIKTLAKASGRLPQDLTVCILERPRHDNLIEEIRQTGASIRLIVDGDVAAIMHCSDPYRTGIDIYMGIGGAPEGVLAAAALKCMGGQLYGRLVFRNDHETNKAKTMNIHDLERIYSLDDLVQSDVIFSATGVTDGSLLKGIRRYSGYVETDTILLRSKTGSKRHMTYSHPLKC